MRRRTMLIGGAALAGATTVVARGFRSDLADARSAVAVGSSVIGSRSGDMEYAEAGSGQPVLMLHGTGGGFDQGLAFTRRLWDGGGFRIIAPSRFGYLRTAFPSDASTAAQADALVDLLDHLGIDRLPVMGGSAGALPAIEFAVRHPDRCAALVAIVPATHVPGRAPMRPNAIGAAIMRNALRSDLLFWAGMHLAEDRMIATLLATDPALVHAAPIEEEARVRAILRSILPISARAEGLLNDGALAGSPAPQALDRIAAPTLAISLDDDRFFTADAARHIAASIPDARLVIYPTGGHVWVGRDADLMGEVGAFLRGL